VQSGLATLIIGEGGESEHVAFELSNRSGLLFARQALLENARTAKHVRLVILTAKSQHIIRIGNVEASCASFSVLRDIKS